MRQISGDVIKVITTNEHFPLGGCLVPHWQERLTCFLHIYLDYLQGILKVVKAPCKKRIDQSLTTQGWQRGKCTCSWVMGILTRVWRTFLRGDNKPIFKWLCAWCVGTQSFSCVWLFAASWTVACQAHLSMEFSRQEYWVGLPFPTPGGSSWSSNGTNPSLLHWQALSLSLSHLGSLNSLSSVLPVVPGKLESSHQFLFFQVSFNWITALPYSVGFLWNINVNQP